MKKSSSILTVTLLVLNVILNPIIVTIQRPAEERHRSRILIRNA